MSYAASAALQQAVYSRLNGDAALNALGATVYDALPGGDLPDLAVVLGAEQALDGSDKTQQGLRVDFRLEVVSAASGFLQAKQAAGAISDALVAAPLILSRGLLIGIWFLQAKATRDNSSDRRRIEMRFRARIDEI